VKYTILTTITAALLATSASAGDSISQMQAEQLAALVERDFASADQLHDDIMGNYELMSMCLEIDPYKADAAYSVLSDARNALWEAKVRANKGFNEYKRQEAALDYMFSPDGNGGAIGLLRAGNEPTKAIREVCEGAYAVAEALHQADADNPIRYSFSADHERTKSYVDERKKAIDKRMCANGMMDKDWCLAEGY